VKLYGADHPAGERAAAPLLHPARKALPAVGLHGRRARLRQECPQAGGPHLPERGAFPTTGLVTRAWAHGRFSDPYLREDLEDFGILIDTLEWAVTWDTLERVHRGVREVCKARPNTIGMTHLSHACPQGAILYFIFLAKIYAIPDDLAFQSAIPDAIRAHGAALSATTTASAG